MHDRLIIGLMISLVVDCIILLGLADQRAWSGRGISAWTLIKRLILLCVLSAPFTLIFEFMRPLFTGGAPYAWGPWVVPLAFNGMFVFAPFHAAPVTMFMVFAKRNLD